MDILLIINLIQIFNGEFRLYILFFKSLKFIF
jgi:hypothetical protein